MLPYLTIGDFDLKSTASPQIDTNIPTFHLMKEAMNHLKLFLTLLYSLKSQNRPHRAEPEIQVPVRLSIPWAR